jgi:hypothetical protein
VAEQDSDDIITLEVPERVQAVYLVPSGAAPPSAAELVQHVARQPWEGILGQMVTEVLEAEALPLDVRSSRDIPPLPIEMLAAMGATDDQLRRVESASHLVLATLQSQAGWPPIHEWVTRALATASAELLGCDVVDILNYRVLDPAEARRTLPDPDGRVRLADWVFIHYSADRSGYWCTTTGLGRFGLPELQTLAAPPHVVELWSQTMTGIAHRLLGAWSEALADDRDAAFVQLRSQLEITSADVAAAYGEEPERAGGPAAVRLALDPGTDPDDHSFLTVHPPLDWAGSAGEHIAEVCTALYGPRAGGVRHAPSSAVMDRAIATARAGLAAIRDRFESGRLDLREKLLVKFAVPADAGTEYLWAYVTSWRDADRILAISAADAIYHPRIRAGRPVVVDAATVVDWAVEHDERGIVEGGWTQAALEDT